MSPIFKRPSESNRKQLDLILIMNPEKERPETETETKPKESVLMVWIVYMPLMGLSQKGIDEAVQYYTSPNGAAISEAESVIMAKKILEDGVVEEYNEEELAYIITAFNRAGAKVDKPEKFEFSDLIELSVRIEKMIEERQKQFEASQQEVEKNQQQEDQNWSPSKTEACQDQILKPSTHVAVQ